MSVDTIKFLQKLITKKSVTPSDEGAMELVSSQLKDLGFEVQLFELGDSSPKIKNLYAKLDRGGKNLCFAGHTDVVPEGYGWKHDPFSAAIEDDVLYGRGAVDMKGAIACFIGAVSEFLEKNQNVDAPFSLSFLITGDEEGPATFGTKELLKQITDKIDYCIVGEPTSENSVADAIKIGRRGSINAELMVAGVQGHVAYPESAHNPIHDLVSILNTLQNHEFADSSDHFPASTFATTSIDVGNAATNVIPSSVKARFNIRTSNLTNADDIRNWLEQSISKYTKKYDLNLKVSGESFLSDPVELLNAVNSAVAEHVGKTPEITTKGGTSDARFIKDYCDQIVELGLKNDTAHKVDECVLINDLALLQNIYYSIIYSIFIKV